MSGDKKKNKPYISFSENLQALTGLPSEISKEGLTVGKNSWDVTGGMQNMYIYSDLVQYSNIGDTTAPVLSVVNYRGGPGKLEHLEYEPTTPVYVPVSHTVFDSIRVKLITKTGDYFPFTSGETMLLVHVRPREPRL